MCFKIPTSESTFALKSFRDWMHWKQLNTTVVWCTHFSQYFSKTNKWHSFLVYIVLINFVSTNYYFMFVTNFDNGFNIFTSENLTRWITRINNNHCPQIDTKIFCCLNSTLNINRVNSPTFILIKEILY